MKAIAQGLSMLMVCLFVAGCSTCRLSKEDTTRLICISQSTGDEYRMLVKETRQMERKKCGWFGRRSESGDSDSLTYPPVNAKLGQGPVTAGIEDSKGMPVILVSLEILKEKDSTIALYELSKRKEDGSLDKISGRIDVQ